MEVYRAETAEILRRFTGGRISHPECVAALDAALAAVFPALTREDLPVVRRIIVTNNEVMIAELKCRGQSAKAPHIFAN